ncbi:MAG: TonB-dependent receptor [Balneolaceae bacterium]
MGKYKLLLTVCLFFGLATAGMAQTTVTGTVTDEGSGETLPGVNVVLAGTDSGVITDLDGNYSINVPSDATLRFSYVGYQPQEIAVAGRSEINVSMSLAVLGGEEVIVVGYGTQTRETLSGSVSSLSGERMERVPVTNLSNQLTGTVPGVITVTDSGEPGYDGASIRIRGNSTLNNNNPLIVIDGVPDRRGGLDRINPRDIESISVLKDASAAIYGSRAANGVILVTTKRGEAGAPEFNFDINQGFNQPTRIPEMADAATYMTMLNETDSYAGRDLRYTQSDIDCHRLEQDPWNCPNTDWFAEALKPMSYQTRADMSISGGSQSMRYRLSFGGLTEDGYYENSATRYNEYQFRSNLDGQLTDNISMTFDVVGRLEERNFPTEGAGATFRMLMRGKPNEPGFWPNGLPAPDIENGTNPVVTGTDATGYDRDARYYLQSNTSVTVEIPRVEGLSFIGNAAVDVYNRDRKRWQTPWTLYALSGFDSSGEPILNASQVPFSDPRLTEERANATDITVSGIAQYRQDLENHSYTILVGAERETGEDTSIGAFRRYYPSTQIQQLDAGAQDQQDIWSGAGDYARINFFSRVNYNYQSKYMVELIGRYDGSYIFPEDSRFGFFPSVSAAWRLTQEDWFTNATDFFDELKLRSSWGQTGNDRISAFQYLSTYEFGRGHVFGGNIVQSIEASRTPNPNVTWEVANQFDVGVEASMFDNKLSLEVDYYNYLRTDILHQRNASVPQTAGISLPEENIGEVKSWGWDGNITWSDQISPEFLLDVSFGFGYATNEIQFWDEAPGAPEWQQSTGFKMDTNLYYKSLGVFDDWAEVESTPSWPGARPGDVIFEDINGDGVIDSDDRYRDRRTYFPEYNGGLNISGVYKSIDFTLLLEGATGAAQYISTQSGDFGNYFQDFAEDRWTPDNPTASQPRAFQRQEEYWMAHGNTHFLHNTDYVRLKNAEIGYRLPSNLAAQLGLQRLRVYANGFNLLTFSKFWMDPEARNSSGSYYPQKRVVNVGLSVTF